MRFHALLPVRDESDIISQCLSHLLSWSDAVYVFDTGSVDDTWEIVQEFASRDKRIIPLNKDPVFFAETRLRGWVFNQARQHMREGDWFLRVDADEFHHIAPPEFVKTRMRSHETIAFHQYYDFRLTQSEVEKWINEGETINDRDRPIEERRRWYTVSVYCEPRLCRYRSTMRWPATASFPYNAGFIARERLPIRHYPHRDPVQMNRRCRLRAIMMADETNRKNWTQPELHHWSEQEWKKFITPDTLPGLHHWAPGSELPEFHQTNHLAALKKRALQRIVHACLLPLLDRMRPKWQVDTYPQRIPSEVIQTLERELQS